ncbi:Uncharacterised protein [Serratia liquefaciens]|nr:Uncharacterised protein [Serratia liquefaciens]
MKLPTMAHKAQVFNIVFKITPLFLLPPLYF